MAVKRVLPPFIKGAGSKASLASSNEIVQQKSSNNADRHSGNPSSTKIRNPARGRKPNSELGHVDDDDDDAVDIESGDSSSKNRHIRASASMSGSSNDWERLLNMRHIDNDTLRVLESATAFRNGSDTFQGSVSQSQVILRYIPMFMRWDAQSTRIREFHSEMRLISRLRVCIECLNCLNRQHTRQLTMLCY